MDGSENLADQISISSDYGAHHDPLDTPPVPSLTGPRTDDREHSRDSCRSSFRLRNPIKKNNTLRCTFLASSRSPVPHSKTANLLPAWIEPRTKCRTMYNFANHQNRTGSAEKVRFSCFKSWLYRRPHTSLHLSSVRESHLKVDEPCVATSSSAIVVMEFPEQSDSSLESMSDASSPFGTVCSVM